MRMENLYQLILQGLFPIIKVVLKLLPTYYCFRIAVIVLNYKDLCKGKPFSTGAQGFRERLLIQSGYRVVKVKHTEFDPREKLVKKVQYLEHLIKNVMSPKRM